MQGLFRALVLSSVGLATGSFGAKQCWPGCRFCSEHWCSDRAGYAVALGAVSIVITLCMIIWIQVKGQIDGQWLKVHCSEVSNGMSLGSYLPGTFDSAGDLVVGGCVGADLQRLQQRTLEHDGLLGTFQRVFLLLLLLLLLRE